MSYTKVTSRPGRRPTGPKRVPLVPAPPPRASGPAKPKAAAPPRARTLPRVLKPWKSPRELTFYVHAHGPTVRLNKETGRNYPLVLIRRSDRLGEMVIARHVEIPGPSQLQHRHSQPLPETENNAVAVLETKERPVAYFDPPGPTDLAHDVPLSSCSRVTLTDAEWARRAQRATHQISR